MDKVKAWIIANVDEHNSKHGLGQKHRVEDNLAYTIIVKNTDYLSEYDVKVNDERSLDEIVNEMRKDFYYSFGEVASKISIHNIEFPDENYETILKTMESKWVIVYHIAKQNKP